MRQWRIERAPAAADLDAVAELLRAGGVVLLPTDTIYGFHAIATHDAAVGELATIKGRDEGKPFVVIGSCIRQLTELGISIRPDVDEILTSLWPAPLTAILPLAHPIAASRGARSLAVRIPALDWLRELLDRTGPLASSSANLSGQPPISSPDELAPAVRERLAGIVDGGLYAGEPSVIVDFTGAEARLVREGEPGFTQKVWKTLRKTL